MIYEGEGLCKSTDRCENRGISMPENNGATYELFSLDDIYNQYNYGDMYQIDKTVLLGFGLGRQINGSYTIDINGLNPSHIQPLNPLLKKMFSRV